MKGGAHSRPWRTRACIGCTFSVEVVAVVVERVVGGGGGAGVHAMTLLLSTSLYGDRLKYHCGNGRTILPAKSNGRQKSCAALSFQVFSDSAFAFLPGAILTDNCAFSLKYVFHKHNTFAKPLS